jgi:transposase-like protein
VAGEDGAPGAGGAAGGRRRHRWTEEEEARLIALMAEEESRIGHEQPPKMEHTLVSEMRHEDASNSGHAEASRIGQDATRQGSGRERRAAVGQTLAEMYCRVAERMGGVRSAHACRLRMRQLRGGGGEGQRVEGTAGAPQDARLRRDDGRTP